MKKTATLLFQLFLVFSIYSQGITIENKLYAVDTLLFQKQIGPGVYQSSYRLPAYPLDFFVMEVDLTNPYNQIETVKAQDKGVATEQPTNMAKRKHRPGHEIIAGTNGDFYFYIDAPEIGIPRSGQFLNGEIIANPTGRASFILGKNKKPYVDRIDFRSDLIVGESGMRIHTVNMLRLEWEPNATDFLTLYTDKFGTSTSAIDGGTKVVVRSKIGDSFTTGSNDTIVCVVESIDENTGVTPIPTGKAVLHGRDGASTFLQGLTVGQEVKIAFRTRLRTTPEALKDFKEQVGGSDCIVLKYGTPQDEAKTAASGKNPRTGMGFSQDSTRVYMVVADGRSGKSVGLDLLPFGELFKAVGAWNAVNLDGGGSSVMFANDQKIVNVPSGGVERAVGNGVLVVSTAPEDNDIGMIKSYDTRYVLPHLGEYTPKFYGSNKYGVLLNSDLDGVVLSCPASLGTIQGNKFIATGNTPGKITATYNGNVVTTIDISFIPVSSIKIRLDSVLMDNRRDYPIEVMAVTDAGEAPISPAAFAWNVEDESVCTVTNGVAKALKNGKTKLTGKINDVQDEIMVHVEIPDAPQVTADSIHLNDWTMTASSFLNAKWNEENRPATWETGSVVNFVHAAGRAPFIKLTNRTPLYGLPDTVKLVMNIGDMAISRAIFSFLSNVSTRPVTTEFNAFVKNSDFSLDVPLDLLFDTNDRANYPIAFDNVNFYLDAANQVSQQAYSLAVKEIALVYKDYVITAVPNTRSASFHVYPNPVKDELLIRMDDRSVKPTNAQLYDLSGKLVKAWKLNAGQSEVLSLGMSDVKQATYLLQLSTDEKKIGAVKIVKQNTP